jgi:hypothetical protein
MGFDWDYRGILKGSLKLHGFRIRDCSMHGEAVEES